MWGISLLAALAVVVATGVPSAQSGSDRYKARLSPLGVTGATVNTVTGAGSATAVLEGTKLVVDGTFEGLTGAATTANVRRGPKAIPGPVVFDLEVTKASKGTIKGTFDLKPDQIEDLKAGRLYVQIHSERAPDGSIRGWLLK